MENNKSSFKKVAEVVGIINMVVIVGGCMTNPYYNNPYMPVVPRHAVNRSVDPWNQYQYYDEFDYFYYKQPVRTFTNYPQPRKTLANPYQQKQQADANAELLYRKRLEAERRDKEERYQRFNRKQQEEQERRRADEKRFDYYNNLKARGGRGYW